jgi:exopolyphosphatase / guanosine-5'-triphosphate,3'-diphosphate pyrophosphatase
VPRWLGRDDLHEIVDRLAGMDAAHRSELPGVSLGRAPQLLAGALVAEAALDLLQVERIEICPWALREGLIVQRLDQLAP